MSNITKTRKSLTDSMLVFGVLSVTAIMAVLSLFKDRFDGQMGDMLSNFSVWRIGSHWIWIAGVFAALLLVATLRPKKDGPKQSDQRK